MGNRSRKQFSFSSSELNDSEYRFFDALSNSRQLTDYIVRMYRSFEQQEETNGKITELEKTVTNLENKLDAVLTLLQSGSVSIGQVQNGNSASPENQSIRNSESVTFLRDKRDSKKTSIDLPPSLAAAGTDYEF